MVLIINFIVILIYLLISYVCKWWYRFCRGYDILIGFVYKIIRMVVSGSFYLYVDRIFCIGLRFFFLLGFN